MTTSRLGERDSWVGSAARTDVHAAVYARQSDARENASEASTTTQREQGTAEARRRDAKSVTYYEDPLADPTGPEAWWHSAPLAERRRFVKLFVDRITVSKSKERGGRGPVHERVKIDFAKRQETADDAEGQRVL